MAINTFELCEDSAPLNLTSTSKVGNLLPDHLRTPPNTTDAVAKRGRLKRKKHSPYLNGDRIQLLSRITEKRFIHKKNELFSSFPLANNIYRASSDEFKAVKKNRNRRKAKKSVHTLPNEPAPIPQSCTVSDMNDSEYYQHIAKANKRAPNRNRKYKTNDYYDRDAKHFHLFSSTDLLHKNIEGGKQQCNEISKKSNSDDVTAQDVWSVLRNINKFQFRSPKISESSDTPPRRKKTLMKRNRVLRNGRRLIETCRTQEIAYVANFELHSKSSVSRTESFDRVTVINKHDTLNKRNDPTKALSKNNNLQRLPNKPKNLVSVNNDKNVNKCQPKTTKTLQYHNNRGELANKNKLYNLTKQQVFDEKLHSSCTLEESCDSSNCYRVYENEYLFESPMKSKILKHPNEIEDIILNGTLNNYVAYVSPVERLNRGLTAVAYEFNTNKHNIHKPKTRLVTTMPSDTAMPKLTSSDMKKNNHEQQNRRLLPVDHITSNLRKINNELHMKVKDKKTAQAEAISETIHKKKVEPKRRSQQDETRRKSKPIRFFKDKMLRLLYKKPSECAVETEQTVTEIKAETKIVKVDVFTETPKETTQMAVVKKEISNKPQEMMIKISRQPYGMTPGLINKFHDGKYPWAKAKWASDFVDNIIRKIKSGDYYCYEAKYKINNNHKNMICADSENTHRHDVATYVDFNDVSVQTYFSLEADLSKKVKFKQNLSQCIEDCDNLTQNYDQLPYIPGFDDKIPELEIKTLNANQIAVKHRLSNVLVQFDVAVPKRTSAHLLIDKDSSSSSCIPLSETDSHTKVFKCNTTILNAVLPAELCTVLPKVIRNIFDSNSSLTIKTSVTDSHITISEISETESTVPSISSCRDRLAAISNQWMYPRYSQWVCPQNNQWINPQTGWAALPNIPPADPQTKPLTAGNPRITNGLLLASHVMPENVPIYISPIMKPYLYGRFLPSSSKYCRGKYIPKCRLIQRIKLSWSDDIVLLPKLNTNNIIQCIVNPMEIRNYDASELNVSTTESDIVTLPNLNEVQNCLALQPYAVKQECMTAYVGDFKSLLRNMWNYCKFNIHFNIPCYVQPLRLTRDNNSISVDMMVTNNDKVVEKVTVTVKNHQLNSLFKRLDGTKNECRMITSNSNTSSVKCIDYAKNVVATKTLNKTRSAKKIPDKLRKKGYVKLYKKCKSTSNISGEILSTSLSKILTLDDFFHALGSAKALSSVFDGCSGQKVMKCVDQMKNWIRDVTPRQALLILLLTNKKDTPNLLQFRPVILQGIAVNRITRATELDMEIEVIERENVKLAQYEGISYIPASVDNTDSLLEELCWIAKTTASDYNKPFDESSERLLKSLLEKRKKLNPSYLRVMARYVGLGLLKTTIKHDKHL